ncbi:response regulator [Pseudomaricurvus alkylphenolicus]|uniref:PAS domain-containing hybrid sensor histidine kinase/response regulator n=1 Tax=Pseudomaricurvus alkylphenolicus TaxID=1306991 RepID=UPI00142471AB|nr:PAS domain-containing hybrid sensor histidine kinase/response regulator [Pseudomaricurvus alkylphenolicus]NIB40233.1 response regulator [Pseudomaricurvus alkylphenolicus]
MDSQLLLFLVCVYSALLFGVAWLAERYGHRLQQPWWRPLVYTLSIGVYCSSWTFLGAVGQAVENGWIFLPIYLGPILLVLFGWRFLRRLLVISSRNKVTSIADFIGSRYGKSQRLAAIVTLVLVVGTLPYITLQLRGVGIAWSSIQWGTDGNGGFDALSSLIAAIAMAWFAILFGTRVIDGPDRHRGMITAVAVESVVKVVAFVVVAMLAVRLMQGSGVDVANVAPNFSVDQLSAPLFFTEMLLAAVAIVCLPRQFHVMVVEYHHRSDLRYTRFLLPAYLATFAMLVLPLAHAGAQLFSGLDVDPDSYVLTLPRWAGAEPILALTFIGALSAATGMVVVATVALSIMISNELIVPIWLRSTSSRGRTAADLGWSLRLIRRVSIVAILLLGWGLEQLMSSGETLASMGLISFAATAQLMPAVLGALYWPGGHARGVVAGVLSGMVLWLYCLLLPAVLHADHPFIISGLFGVTWLAPQNILGLGWLDPLSHGVFWSLLVNALVFVFVSKRSTFRLLDIRQADAFTRLRWKVQRKELDLEPSGIEVRQLQALMEPLFGPERTQDMWQEFEHRIGHRLLPHDQTPRFAVTTIESDLAAIIGAVSAHRAMQLLISQQPLQLQDFVSLVGGSSRQLQFSQTLLQTTLETIPQGISVVDKDLRLVAWNQQYQKLFDYPQRLLYVGCDIEKIYHYNAMRGYLGDSSDDPDVLVSRRLQQLRSGSPHRIERQLPSGEVVEIRGTPLANGGYVTTYTDVSEYHGMLLQLEHARNTLEERVNSRTAQLQSVNERMQHVNQSLQRENDLRARVEQELKEVHASKSRFLAAASHDLLQPINAARLFVSSMSAKLEETDIKDCNLKGDVNHLDDALNQAEQLISSLREISRLGSGKERPKRENFPIERLLSSLAGEASALAGKQGLEFRWVPCSLWVNSDPHLLRRVLQNFISNALRYTREGKVLLGCRRHREGITLEVWDTGPGIAEQDRQRIFEEFERLPSASMSNQGLGLGLSIAQRIAQLLGHPISLDSTPGKGSVFRITVALGEVQTETRVRSVADSRLTGLRVLCVDNEATILAGMQSLLEQWGCRVTTAADLGQALSLWSHDQAPQLVLADFHLEEETGLDVLEALGYHWQRKLPAVIISADNSDEVRGQVQQAGCLFLAKPVQPAALRALMRRALRRQKVGVE